MTIKNMLLLVLGVIVAAASASAKIINDSLYEIPKTNVVPLIDGKQDGIWKVIDWNFQRIYNVGDPPVPSSAADSGAGLTGMSKAMWDESNLYILFYCVDNILTDIPTNPGWNQDAIEIFIDADNSKTPDGVSPDPGSGLAQSDLQLVIPHLFKGAEADNLPNISYNPSIPLTGVEYKITDVANSEGFPGWMLEMKIPLENLGIDGLAASNQLIGWELEQDESDDVVSGRQSMSKWWSSSNNSWTDASIWGTAILSDRVVDTVLEIKKLPNNTTITIDGNMDPVYKLGNPVAMNNFRVDGLGNASDPMFDAYLTAYPLWDTNNLYIFFDITDDDIQNNPGQPNWNKDAIYLYIDADNSKNPGGPLGPGDFFIIIPHEFMGVEIANISKIFQIGSIDTTGVEFRISEREGGWGVELKIPMTTIGIDAMLGSEIGLEIDMAESDAGDGGSRGSIEKWWGASDISWNNPSVWGTAYLGFPTGTPANVPALFVNPTSLQFGYQPAGTISTAKTYTLSGSNLSPSDGLITVKASKNFEVSKSNGSGFDSLVTVSYSGAALAPTTIYVRFKPTSSASYNGFVTNSGGGVGARNVSVSGNSISHVSTFRLLSVTDVPYDQGGNVMLTWEPSPLDTNTVFLPYYSIWRAVSQNILDTIISMKRDIASLKTPARISAGTSGTLAWEWVANQPSHGLSLYAYTASTLYDSMSSTDAVHYFMVSAQTSNPNVFYDSNIDSGYSVDNLPPSIPANVAGQLRLGKVTLRWNRNTETDLKYYVIYRSQASTVNPDLVPPFAFTADTIFSDGDPLKNTLFYYVVRAADVHENISAPSNKVSFTVTGVEDQLQNLPTEYVLEQNYPNPFNPSTSIRYGVPTRSRVRLQVYSLLGQMVSELVNSEQEAGWYHVEWGVPVSSGLYFYRIEAVGISEPDQKFVQLRKMLLLK